MPFKTLPTVQIGAHTYTVELKDASSSSGWGHQADSQHQVMEINLATVTIEGKQRAVSDVEQMLLHELCHSIDIIWKCDISEDNIERLAQGLLQVLKQYGLVLIEQVEDTRG